MCCRDGGLPGWTWFWFGGSAGRLEGGLGGVLRLWVGGLWRGGAGGGVGVVGGLCGVAFWRCLRLAACGLLVVQVVVVWAKGGGRCERAV
jgi:hypothetical protein